jgi:hypothetical protein
MWHSLGDPKAARRQHVNWARLRAEMERFVEEQRARQANDNEADACAMRFAECLEEALLDLDSGEGCFDRATRKADHVEELRRVLGLLLDVLADWEMTLERMR